jgi:hypothetical protein
MPPGVAVELPVGLIRDGVRQATATLRPLDGHEELLVDEAVRQSVRRADLVSAVLAACVTAIGDVTGVNEALVDSLAAGDREALLLHLRRLTFGESIAAIVACPGCAERLDLDLMTADLLVAPAAEASSDAELELEADGVRWRVLLRRPTGADQRALHGTPDPAAALLRRCVLSLIRADGVAWRVDELSAALAEVLDAALATCDPQAEIRLDVTCPACALPFAAPFDAAAHLFVELAAEAHLLLGEVVAIAGATHWREADILALPRSRRRAYAALVAGR